MKMEFMAFEKEHISDASGLLAAQFSRLRTVFPLLPGRIEKINVTKDFLLDLHEKDTCNGVVMRAGGKMHGFLLGNYGGNPFFGRHVYVPFGGIALSTEVGTEALSSLYAAAGQKWVNDEILNHYLVLPALPDWLETAFSLSFGKEQVYAVASMEELRPKFEMPAGIVMREVEPSDADALSDCADWIASHYNLAPVWEPVPAEHLADIRKGYAGLADEEESITWIALDGERIVSFMVICPEDISPSCLFGETGVTHFPVAATHPVYRGRGIGRVLFTHVMNLAAGQETKIMTTDWRSTNKAAARTWSRFGFDPYAYRLIRRVNPRYKEY